MINGSDRSRWTDERLDRLADAVDGLREQQEATNMNIEALREQQEATNMNIEALREQQEATNTNIDTLVGIVTGHQERFTALLEEIRDIKAEIKGLQTENRRILDHLFAEPEE